jgi:ubiquinone/menaquinone biosynthesis C-methylase UbiE
MNNVYTDPATAQRYDAARDLPAQTKALWLDAIKSSISTQNIRKILDLGCGTGRFTVALAEAFGCPVAGIDPSEAMLRVATSQDAPGIQQWVSQQREHSVYEPVDLFIFQKK